MRRKLELTPRLQKVADWVPCNARLADIGTDHAYLPAWLVSNGRVCSAIASDLRQGPLHRAEETCRCYGTETIQLRLCAGLEGIAPDEADTVVIAGMGGETIASILEAAPWTADGAHLLLLQPMTKVESLRAFLSGHGYAIQKETVVCERGTLYSLLMASGGEQQLSLGEIYGGVGLTEDPLGDRYLIHKIVQLQSAVVSMKRSSDPAAANEANRLREIIAALLVQREEWRHANSTTV